MSSVGRMIANAPRRSCDCNSKMHSPTDNPTVNERMRSLVTSAKSRLPRACEVIPLVPIRRNPNTQ